MTMCSRVIRAVIAVSLLLCASAVGKAKQAPKNIIVMISDGCGYYHVDAAGLYQYGRTGAQVYERFSVVCGMSTYMAGGSYDPCQVWGNFNHVKDGATDSAAAATAMSCGAKTYNGAIGVDSAKKPLKNIIERCEERGMATGVVTSVQLSHATPAGFVAHNEARGNYAEIAREMIYNSAVDCIIGCGHPLYDGDGNLIEDPNAYKYVGGEKAWNELTAGTAGSDADGDGVSDPWVLIETRAQFQALASGQSPKRVFGVPLVAKTLQQARSGDSHAEPYTVPMIETVPTLEEMTRAALNVLDNDVDGFFLMVEGGAVDWAGHANQSGRVIEEEIDFNKSVEAVVDWVRANSNWGETLVIVTGDHETGYLTGPDSDKTENDPVWQPLLGNGKGNQPGMEWHSNGHTNSLVPFYAKGCGAGLFNKAALRTDPDRGPYIDNTDIAKVIFALLAE